MMMKMAGITKSLVRDVRKFCMGQLKHGLCQAAGRAWLSSTLGAKARVIRECSEWSESRCRRPSGSLKAASAAEPNTCA